MDKIDEVLPDATRRRITDLQERLVRIQSQCIVTRDSLRFHGRRCSVLEEAIRTCAAFRDDRSFVVWRSLVTRFWHRLRSKVGWRETRGIKYLAREMGDLEARLKRQCACVEWGLSEDAFVCACALAEEENYEWKDIFDNVVAGGDGPACGGGDGPASGGGDGPASGGGDGPSSGVGDWPAPPFVPDFGSSAVGNAMKFALEFVSGEMDSELERNNLFESEFQFGNFAEERGSEDGIMVITQPIETDDGFMIIDKPFETGDGNEKRIRTSKIPRLSMTAQSTIELSSPGCSPNGHKRKSKIPLVSTMRSKRASIAAIPLTPPRAADKRKSFAGRSQVFESSKSCIPKSATGNYPRKLVF